MAASFEELIVLLPCHSLEDFPVYREGADAESLLAAWTALWHPALIAAADRLPIWYRADNPPENLAGKLILVPGPSESLLLAGWAARVQSEGAHVVRKLNTRQEMVAAALAGLDSGDGGVEPDLAEDFLALGFAYLMVELLTRQMRYMSHMDEIHLRNTVTAAAKAAVAGDADTARQQLTASFEVLTEARERFYPVDNYLVDLTLAADTTLGTGLRRDLAGNTPQNLLIAAEVLEQMAKSEPDSLQLLLDRQAAGTLVVVGGEANEGELPLLPPEALLQNLLRGGETYQRILGKRPTIFGRRRAGLSPVLPQYLARTGFMGALHVTLDEGQFPRSDQSKFRWEGIDSCTLDALGRLPLDARLPESFLGLPRALGESMDLDHVATVVFAHWPGQACSYYEDLRRVAKYGAPLGKFITLADYFDHTASPGSLTKHRPDQYRTPYLRQAIIRNEADALSRVARQYQQAENHYCATTLHALADMLAGIVPESAAAITPAAFSAADATTAATRLSQQLPHDTTGSSSGCMVFNPYSFTRSMLVDLPGLKSAPAIGGSVVATQLNGTTHCAVVEVPPVGFVWVAAAEATAAKSRAKPPKPLAEGHTLRNDLIEVILHPETGGIRAIHELGKRGNRLSQQLAYRLPSPRPKPGDLWRDPDETAEYSVAACDSIEVTSPGPAYGEIVTRGRLLDREGKLLAGFKQTFQLAHGSRVVLMEIELDVAEAPRADAWNSYYAARFAWSDSLAELYRGVSQNLQFTDAKRIESPQVVEIRDDNNRVAILCGGLPYHRRMGERMLDSMLMVRGETQRVSRLAIGIGLAHPLQDAVALLAPPTVVPDVRALPARQTSGWLFHVDAKNVLATHWSAMVEEGRVVGFHVRLMETEGRAGRVKLRAFKNVATALHVDFTGQTLVPLATEQDRISIDFAAFEWIEVKARFQT